jgi:WD40 repeat protein
MFKPLSHSSIVKKAKAPSLLFLIIAFFIAPEVLAAPILRIEVGQHTAMINRMAIDKAGKLMATASDDKTVRLWNLPEGTLYTTLRVPIGEQLKGALYAVAVSPDGKTVITAGETVDTNGKFSLYVFDVEKRVLKARISSLPSAIYHLAYSRDGRYFGAAFAGGYGIRVWDSQTGKTVALDSDYGERCTWLDFNESGYLATVSHDGFVRLYDNRFALIKKERPHSQAKPNSTAFSPDGQRLAIGYSDLKRVDVLDLNLSPLASLPSDDLQGRNSAIVEWKPGSGSELYAGGDLHTASGDFVVRHWRDITAANPPYEDIRVSRNIVTDIVSPANDSEAGWEALFASADPSWGVLHDDQMLQKHRASLWDARLLNLPDKTFALSPDGLKVAYSQASDRHELSLFDVSSLTLQNKIDREAWGELLPAVRTSAKIKLAHWLDDVPVLNGKKLAFDPYEKSLSFAVDPKTQNFLIGTNYYLRLYAPNGREIQKITVPAEVDGINIAANGKLAVAALGDGTLRWYSLGADELLTELISLFHYNDGKDWIIWTKEGFFGNSDGGGYRLAGYHLNKGDSKRPEWIEFSQLYQAYYAPELILPKLLRQEDVVQSKVKALDSVENNLNKKAVPIITLTEYCVNPKQDMPAPASAKETGDEGIIAAIRNFFEKLIVRIKTLLGIEVESDEAISKPVLNPAVVKAAPVCHAIMGQGQTRGFKRKGLSQATFYRNQLDWNADSIELRYSVKAREGGIGDIDIYVNGQIQASEKKSIPYAADGQDLILARTIAVKEGENEISVHAYEQTGGVSGVSDSIVLTNPGQLADAQSAGFNRSINSSDKPRLIVFAIGIDRYEYPNQLKYAVKDASDFIKTISTRKSPLYSEVLQVGLFDEQATLPNIEASFDKIQSLINKNDSVLVYLSGHGIREERDYYFIPYGVDDDNLDETALSQRTLKKNIAKLSKTNKVFVFLDSCHSGAVDTDKINREVAGFDKIKHQLGDGVFVLAAAGENQEAQDQFRLDGAEKADNGLFAYAVLEGLNGKARRIEDNIIDSYNLGSYVQRRIDALTKNQTLYRQKARFQKLDAGDILSFDIAQYE